MNISVRSLKPALCLFLFVFLLFSQTKQTSAQTPAIQLQLQASGLSSPVLVTHAGDSRLFIVQQGGIIKVFEPGVTTPTDFINLTSKVTSGGERGLLGLAFHPQFATNSYFFVNYTRASDGATVIARYSAINNNTVGDLSSEVILLTIPQPFSNHNGGMIEFRQDNGVYNLYIGMGDGGSANDPQNHAQNVNSLLGKYLRITPSVAANPSPPYTIPADNPYVGVTGADEIYAIGLRNPWRWSFDRMTGQLWAGDVGQGSREEVDIITRGGNYGWRIMEGTICTPGVNPSCTTPPGHVPPVFEYVRSSPRCAVTGGYVYRGTQIQSLIGSYIYGDYCSGEIFRYQGSTQEVLLDTSFFISSFGEDYMGELYVVSHAGEVYKILPLITAASVSISGRVKTRIDNGISDVLITLSGGNLTEPRTTYTDKRGFYEFPDVEVGQTYVITTQSNFFVILPANQTFTVLDELTNVDFNVFSPIIRLPIRY